MTPETKPKNESSPLGHATSSAPDGVGGTGVSPVCFDSNGRDARATKSPRVAFAISTKERMNLTRQILPALDCGGFDLIWCDGSKTPEGRAFASSEHFKKTPLVEINHDVTGGPDAAIQFSLKRLLALGYDYVGLIENDIVLSPGWLDAMFSAWRAAERDGFKVGAVTARSIASRVLARSSEYMVKWNLGAGMALFSRAGAEAVLADYRLPTAKKLHEFYRANLGVDLSGVWELFMHQPDRGLGADWNYAASMLKRGLVSLGVVPNMAQNIDVDLEEVCGTRYVRSANQLLLPHCISTERLRSSVNKINSAAATPAKPKVAGDISHGKDLTGVQHNSEFERDLRALITRIKPRFIVETGTYLGQGTTRIISSALKDAGLTDTKFYSVECNPEHHRRARENLSRAGLIDFVRPLHGVSVPRSLLPDEEAIREETVANVAGDIFVDHHEDQRIKLYLNETHYPAIPEDLLGACLRECGGKPDLLLLDSAGHMGNVEFNYVLSLLRGPCHLALDDIRHVKHARSIEQMKGDPRFEMISCTEEKFGSCIVKFTPVASELPTDEVKRILFVRTDSIGDAVLASSLLDPLRRRHPHAKINVLCQQHVAELFAACPFVDAVICYDQKKLEGATERAQLLAEITAFNPEIILNAVRSRDHFSNELTQLFPHAKHIAIAGDRDNISETDHARTLAGYEEIIPTADKPLPELARHGDFLRGLGIGTRGLQPAVWTTPADEALAEAFFQQEKLESKKTLALFPCTQHPIKDYPHFAAALAGFASWNILIFGGEEKQAQCAALAQQLPGAVRNLAGRTSLREMAALLRRCRILVGSDSSGAHIACAVGTPNVIVLGGGHFGRFLPYSPLTSTVSLPLDCFGCHWRCPHPHAHCIKDLPPATLAEAIQQTLQNKSTRPRVFISPDRGVSNSKIKWQRPDGLIAGTNVEIIEATPGASLFTSGVAAAPPVHPNYERVACPTCSSDSSTRVRNRADIVQCSNCKTVYLRTRLTKAAMRKLYQSYAEEGSHMALPKSRDEAERSGLRRDYFLTEILEFTAPSGNFLDVGCGWGGFLLNARAKGFTPRGIELTRKCVGYAKEQLAIPVVDTQLEETEIAAASLSVVTMNHVFEHLPEPRKALQKVVDSLQPGGMFCGIVPNFASACSEALGEEWFWLDPNFHYTHFTPKTLRKTLETAGFIVERIYTATGDYGPDAVRQACLKKDAQLTDDDYFAAELKRYEAEGRGEEIRFFARKPAAVARTHPVETPDETILLVPEIMTGPEPLVSVVISTYQSEKFLAACLENLSRQSIFDRCEVIVVDSGSPENERAIVAGFQKRFPNLRYVRTPRETLYAAWNRGLALARGKFWANLNTDDSLRDDALEMLSAALEKNAACALAYGDTAWTTRPNDVFPSVNIVKTVKYPHYAPVATLFYCITGCLQFWRTDSIRTLGGFAASLRCAGDYEATLKLMAARMNAVHVPEVLSLFFQNTTGLTQATNRAALEHEQVMKRFRNALEISNIFQVEAGEPSSAANALAVLGANAARFAVPWESQPAEHSDFAFSCFQKALALDPENLAAGINLLALCHRLNRLTSTHVAALTSRWPKMPEWIEHFRAGKSVALPPVKDAVSGPVYLPAKSDTGEFAREPKALRPWISRIEGRHVYLSEELFPRPHGLRYDPDDLEQAAKRLASLLAELPGFYAHFGGAGDALLLLASFYDTKPDAIVFSHPNSIGATEALFETFPRLSKIYFLPRHAEPFFHIVLRFTVHELRNCLGAGATPRHGYEEWQAGVDLEKKYRIKKSPRWAAALRQNDGSRRIAVAPKGSLSGMVGSKRNLIVPEIWPRVIAHILDRGFAPVIFGLPGEAKAYPVLRGCTDARGESFSEQMRLIGQCAGLVGADSWAKTFSALAEIPTLVFEPLKGADLKGWKDPSDWVFIEPWPAIKVIRSLAEFCHAFDARIARTQTDTELESSVNPQAGKPAPRSADIPVGGLRGLSSPQLLIAWEGSFLDFGSLSQVNRELTRALADSENVRLQCVNAPALPPDFTAPKALQKLAEALAEKPSASTQVTIRHAWPPNWQRPAQGKLVVIQPWEFGSLPRAWVEQAKNVDEFWVPTKYVRAVYVGSGIEAAKVQIVPNGIDPERFHPGATPRKIATDKSFKFLFVGGTIPRKGTDILLDAFLKAFTASDDVALLIKDFGGETFYKGQTMAGRIAEAQRRPNAPEIIYLDKELSPEELPGLYTACDCLVHPYRGEGFGLPVLEAMACGLPVVVTAGGATDDFATDDFAYRVPARRRGIGHEISGLKLAGEGWLLEPYADALAEQLRCITANRESARELGRKASEHVRQHWTWNRAAETALARLQKLAVAATQRVSGEIKPAPVALLGNLKSARSAFDRNDLMTAWNETLAAINARPFHPEAFLHLAEIASAANDGGAAREFAARARALAPKWDKPKQFLKRPLKSAPVAAAPRRLQGGCDGPVARLPVNIESELRGEGAAPTPLRRGVAATDAAARATTLTICLITKNEEKFIGQCLKSVRGLAQQIIVVDTGSTDRTVEIAREHGAEIHSFAWADDFSAARNVALEHATGDWILMLDADEELPAAQHARLRADMKKSEAIAFRLPLVNQGQEADGQSFVPRLFRNAPGVFYHGRIHEQVFPSLVALGKAWGLSTGLGSAQLLHHGYSKELVQDRNKIERNLRLLRLAVEENSGDVNLAMNFGLELVRAGDLPGGIGKYRAAFLLMSAQTPADVVPELREVLLTQFTSHLYKVREHEEVVRVLSSPLAKHGGLTASLHFSLGLSNFELRNYREAAQQMRQCLLKRKQPALSPINTDIHTAAPQHCLALSLARLGDMVGAEKAFQAALSCGGDAPSPQGGSDALVASSTEASAGLATGASPSPSCDGASQPPSCDGASQPPSCDGASQPLQKVKVDYAKFLADQKRHLDALHQLNEVVAQHTNHAAAWRLGGEIALSQPQFLEFARDWTGEAMRHLAEDLAITAQRAEALMLSSDTASARELWERIYACDHQPRALAALILCEATELQLQHGPDDEAQELAASREFVAWYQKLLASKTHPSLERLNEQMEKLASALPTAAVIIEKALREAENFQTVAA